MKSVLFVDDDRDVLDGLRSSLRSRHRQWQIGFVDSAVEARQRIREQHPDAVVTELQLQGRDGTQLLWAARDESPETIRIVLSGYPSKARSIRGAQIAHQYISKPCPSERVAQVLEHALSAQEGISYELRRFVGSTTALPTLPETYRELQGVAANPNYSADDVARVIAKDVSLSTKILQVANSSFFRVAKPIAEIEQAVVHLGLNIISSLVLTDGFFKPRAYRGAAAQRIERLYRHSLLTGRLTERICSRSAEARSAFLSGVLHDVGALMLYTHNPEQADLREKRSALEGRPLSRIEHRELGFDHAALGAYMLRIWGLPSIVTDAVARHHQAPKTYDLSAAVYLAEALLEQGGNVDDDIVRQLGIENRLSAWRSLADEMVNS